MKRIGVFDFWHNYKLCFSWSMANILSDRFEIIYFTTSDFSHDSSKFKVVRLPLKWPEKTTLKTCFRLPFSIYEAISSRRIVKKYNLNSIYFAFDHPLLVFFSFKNIPLLNTVHEFDNRQGIISLLNNSCTTLNLSVCNAVVVMNPKYKEIFEKQKKKYLYFPHPYFIVPSKTNENIHSPLKFLFFGKIRADKGLDILLDALNQLKDMGCKYSLTVAGVGDMNTYRLRIQLLGKSVKVINRFLEDNEILNLIYSHDIAILPYRSATQSGVATLCNSCGMPLIASDLKELKNNIHNKSTGLSFRTGDTASLVDRLNYVIDNPSLIEKFRENIFINRNIIEATIQKKFHVFLNNFSYDRENMESGKFVSKRVFDKSISHKLAKLVQNIEK